MPSEVFCKLLNRKIPEAQCMEISSVAEKFLKKESCPELSDFTNEEITAKCNSCPYSN